MDQRPDSDRGAIVFRSDSGRDRRSPLAAGIPSLDSGRPELNLNRDGSLPVSGSVASGHSARVGAVTKRNGSARRSSGSPLGSKRRRGLRNAGRRHLGEEAERTEVQRLADEGWVEWGDELIWAVGFTSGGAPFGLGSLSSTPRTCKRWGWTSQRQMTPGWQPQSRRSTNRTTGLGTATARSE